MIRTHFRKAVAILTMAAAGFSAYAAPADTAPADSSATALAVFIGDLVDTTLADHSNMGFDLDRKAFISALSDYLSGKPAAMTPAQAKEYLNSLYQSVQTEQPEALAPADSTEQAAFVARAAARADAITLPVTGTVLEVLVDGTGSFPSDDGIVEMRYTGSLSDGTVFDTVSLDDSAIDMPVGALMPGLLEALISGHMRAGGKYRVTVPAAAAYGDAGVPGTIPPGAALQFVLDLISAE